MAILSIRIIGDPVLRTVADPVTDFGPELAKLVADIDLEHLSPEDHKRIESRRFGDD